MYVAQRYIRAQSAEGKIVSYLPGDVIPDFNAWPELSRRAHINQHLVEKVDETQVAAMPPAQEPVVEVKQVVNEAPEEPQAEAADAAYSTYCADCDRSFKDAVGLRVHNTRVHRRMVRV